MAKIFETNWARILFVLFYFQKTEAGDDASVHVHVESAPGPDMGMTLPLFNYYRSATGQPNNPALLTAFQKWHGDEFHSQGPDLPNPTGGGSREQMPSGGSVDPYAQPYADPRRLTNTL